MQPKPSTHRRSNITTIAWDGKTLAADRRAVHQDCISTSQKIFRLEDGRLVGAAGGWTVCQIWMDWLVAGGERPALLATEEEYINGLEIRPDGNCIQHLRHGSVPTFDPFIAFGSGKHFAMAAMACGKTAAQAVEIAAMFDPHTGNGIDTLTLDAD